MKIFIVTEEELLDEIRPAQEKKHPALTDEILEDLFNLIDSHKKFLEIQTKSLMNLCHKITGLSRDEASA